ncbi:MAG: oligoendopeptidase F, partial [Nitratireductor sp.]
MANNTDRARRPAATDAALAAENAFSELGNLPEWNLADLYPAIESPELKRDLDRAAAEAAGFETAWKGKLADEAARGAGGKLGEAVEAYEAIEELMGRIVSYAGLLYAGDTSDPKRAKLYGDVQEKLTDASAHLIFFTLELNKIED